MDADAVKRVLDIQVAISRAASFEVPHHGIKASIYSSVPPGSFPK